MHGNSARDTHRQRLALRLRTETHVAATPNRPAGRFGEGEKRGKKIGMRLKLRVKMAKNSPPILTKIEVLHQLVAELRLHSKGETGETALKRSMCWRFCRQWLIRSQFWSCSCLYDRYPSFPRFSLYDQVPDLEADWVAGPHAH